ncbi:MAG: type II/IV secretion system protein [Planctomycetes bacterium]|nr:type II/IV secretion system protein [Planctomycetota bacterium]
MKRGFDPNLPIDLDRIRIDASWALRVPQTLAIRRQVLLFGEEGGAVYAACADPNDASAIEALERIAGTRVVALRAEPESLRRTLERVFYRREEFRGDDAVRAVDDLLHGAILEQASDIHLEPSSEALRVRYRIDGVLELRREVPAAAMNSIMNRVKVMAGLDIAERRTPQDGRFSYKFGAQGSEQEMDVRVAVLPTKFGERMTLRLLAMQAGQLTLPSLGMAPLDLQQFRNSLNLSHGLILLTGPTGSGKTTTLYAAVRELDLERNNIITIEDPIEYDIEGVSQVEVDPGDRVSFTKALRSVLRHDPDILMIGEIRDLDTADVAVKASLTGHLVFSTLHTNTAMGAITRLVDMGVPPYLVAATLRLSIAQRLVRRLCERCAAPVALTRAQALAFGEPSAEGMPAREPRGCVYCKQSGFVGRIGIFESLYIYPELASAIAAGAREDAFAEIINKHGVKMLRNDALAKVADGTTSAGEALGAVEAG